MLTPLDSSKIAPEIMVIDDFRNGWRNILLPMAHRD